MYIKTKQSQRYGTPVVRDITTSSFTIVTGAKDEISGIEKYECYINGVKKGETEEETGSITITGLSPKTSYDNIVVKVYNNAGIVAETLPVSITTRDICYTSYCSGGSTSNCGTCGGTGKVSGVHSYYIDESYTRYEKNDYSCNYCGAHDKETNFYYYWIECSACGNRVNIRCCCSSHRTLQWNKFQNKTGCTGATCSGCGGTGLVVKPCLHGRSTGSHRYCKHYNVTWVTSHEI